MTPQDFQAEMANALEGVLTHAHKRCVAACRAVCVAVCRCVSPLTCRVAACVLLCCTGRNAIIEEMHSVLDWSELLRPCLVDPLPTGLQHATVPSESRNSSGDCSTEVKSPHSFWIHKNASGEVIMHYKEYSVDKVWLPGLPPAKPTSSNPAGMVLFRSPPPSWTVRRCRRRLPGSEVGSCARQHWPTTLDITYSWLPYAHISPSIEHPASEMRTNGAVRGGF